MAKFEVTVTRIRAIEPIEGADAIEVAVVGDYRSVVRKDQFKAGQLAVYIPEGSLLPVWLIHALGLTGKLAGSDKNRVKAVKLRGVLSQGLLFPVDRTDNTNFITGWVTDEDPIGSFIAVQEGQDVSAELGVVKWNPPIPTNMGGEVYNAGQRLTINFDVENIKKFPDVIRDGDIVVITEKIHGTFTGIAMLPRHEWSDDDVIVDGNHFIVYSKGLGADGLCFRGNEQNRAGNLYVRTLLNAGVFEKFADLVNIFNLASTDQPVHMLGETFGDVQDLKYGGGQAFRAFDIGVGYRSNVTWISRGQLKILTAAAGIEAVPVMYTGPFDQDVLAEMTNGKETVSGKELHIREGVVVTLLIEGRHEVIGRIMLKSVSEAYLLRKAKDATEFQ